MIQATFFLLKHNYFMFESKFFLQISEVAIGAKFSPSLAIIYMAWWESLYIFNEHNPFSNSIRWFCRFIDDLLIIWGGGEGEATIPSFCEYLNCNFLSLWFNLNFHHHHIFYLDLCLIGDSVSALIQSESYRKDIAGNAILHARSCHPSHTLK